MSPRRRFEGDARYVAYLVLEALDEREAFLQPALQAAAQRARLDGRDRGLALELASGVCRWRDALDHVLAQHLSRGLADTPPAAVRVLRLGVYQLHWLDRIPARAAVHATVELARQVAGDGPSRLVNAVLRAVQRAPGPLDEATLLRLAQPAWLRAAWVDEGGEPWADAAARAANAAAPLTVRVDAPGVDRAALIARLNDEGAEATPAAHAPDAVHVAHHPAPFDGAAFRDGWWVAQDEASQLVVHLLDPRPGDQVWDACAAPGGKTRAIARRLATEGRVVATDVHAAKAKRLARALADLGPTVEVEARDAGEPPPGPFDKVLLDAPCTGLGVIRRHPEIKWRRTPEDVVERAATQARLLRAAADAVRPGGVLVYSVCSDQRAEGPDVVSAFLAERPDFDLEAPPEGPVDWRPLLHDGCLRTRPHLHDADGFFAARLRRRQHGPPEAP